MMNGNRQKKTIIEINRSEANRSKDALAKQSKTKIAAKPLVLVDACESFSKPAPFRTCDC